MADHYFTAEPQSRHKHGSIACEYRGHTLQFETDSGVFSREGVDFGTRLLINALPDDISGETLDMGCGYGVIGVAVGKANPRAMITMADVNERACALARLNAARNSVPARVVPSDGYAALGSARYDLVLQNPPIRAGKPVIYAMFAEAARRLNTGGELWLVIRKQQGALSAVSYLKTLFEAVEAVEKKAGYWVLRCARPIREPNPTKEGKAT